MGPVERMLHSQLRVFARYHSAAEHEKMVEGMAVEHHLRTRIAELKECRRAGVRRLADFEVPSSFPS
jgi:transcriptional adapter 2-alpha